MKRHMPYISVKSLTGGLSVLQDSFVFNCGDYAFLEKKPLPGRGIKCEQGLEAATRLHYRSLRS
jgi:hypothetical protein